ncbi:hypothetical protein BD289DRAFT_360 [Coniella lustricola]|uniref:Uncharacterized protein n=1 Tax=Coniella lustricola TaxID=2025994 RepID=A0A2T3AN92_9PEZI|nr:hypothetical protein BD289DRAFT_360 [Coniella lustricola]
MNGPTATRRQKYRRTCTVSVPCRYSAPTVNVLILSPLSNRTSVIAPPRSRACQPSQLRQPWRALQLGEPQTALEPLEPSNPSGPHSAAIEFSDSRILLRSLASCY